LKAFVRIDAVSQEVQLAEVPVPEIQSDEVLVKVEAFGVGIHDRYFINPCIGFSISKESNIYENSWSWEIG
jgi:NADPH:quinone reductase-like Zn-dependent oxidoreductase